MKSITTIVLVLASLSSFAQESDRSLHKAGWKYGKEKEVYRHKILKVEGEDRWGYTNISYTSGAEIVADYKVKAEKQMEEPTKMQATIKALESVKGGRVTVYIGRVTIETGNLGNFAIIIKNLDGQEIFREKMERDVPETPNSDKLWWNIGSVYIKEEVTAPFDVYVVDAIDTDNPTKHFRILN